MLQGYRVVMTPQAGAQGLGPPPQHPPQPQGAAAGARHRVAMAHAGQVSVPAQLAVLGKAHCREFLAGLCRTAPLLGSQQ